MLRLTLRIVPALLAFLPAAALSQTPSPSPTGEIRLHIRDAAGHGLQVTATVSGPTLGANRTLTSSPDGNLSLPNLPPGPYRVRLQRPGFEPQTLSLNLRPNPSPNVIDRSVLFSIAPLATTVTVYPATPIGQPDLTADQVPVPVQSITAAELADTNSLDLTDLMNRRLNGVYINDNAGNPYEPDINYRGYTASPLLGTPEGLSVYLDGVRQNQPFGDIVAWDLIPKVAIASAELIPGANPLYGLNTLGGAIAIQTKSGLTSPGLTLQASGGNFGRAAIEGTYGGANQRGLNWFLAGNVYHEGGWRLLSPSTVRQSFAKLGYTHGNDSLALSATYSNNFLTGNGTQDFRFLKSTYNSVYSVPDITWNRDPSLTLNHTHTFSEKLSLATNAYFRYVRSDTTNGDFNSDSFSNDLYDLSPDDVAALTAAGYTNFPITGNPTTEPFPHFLCIAQGLEDADPSDNCNGVLTNTRTQQNNYGLSGLLSLHTAHNRLAVGAAWDRSSVTYVQASQFAYINPDRVSITTIPSFADGSTTDDDGNPVDTRVQLHGTINTPSLYATDTLSLGAFAITLSGRYNRTAVNNLDRLPLSAARGSLSGSYVFQRFNPAAGLTWRAPRYVTLYANYSEASRAPTSIELGCADPNFPCNLPNALVSDPPLNQVVSRTIEAGIRSTSDSTPFHPSAGGCCSWVWSAGFFRGQNSQDLLFVASQQTGFGYFTNFGRTLRQGAEASLSAQLRHLLLGADYTFLSATYQSPQVIDGGSNSTNASALAGLPGVDDNINIVPGDHIPQTPQHVLKTYADWRPNSRLLVDLNLLLVSSSFARGNENNLDQPDGVYYLGSGSSPGYGTVNLGAHYNLSSRFQIFAQANNLLDRHYVNAAQLGPTPFDNNGNFIAQPFPANANGDNPIRTSTFYAPGAPFSILGGLRLTLSHLPHPRNLQP